MFAAGTISRVSFLILVGCFMGSRTAYPQSGASFNDSKTISSRTRSAGWLAKCASVPTHKVPLARFSEGDEWPPIANTMAADSISANFTDSVCPEPAFAATPLPLPKENPCRSNATRISGAPYASPCTLLADTVPAELSALGKPGGKIARAREEVLDILRSENACTEWFATKDRTPAETFRSLSFLLDPRGPQDIFASMIDQSVLMMRQPYVARATQDGGAYTAIVINANGAFYRAQGQIQKTAPEGGPLQLAGTHLLTVGSYRGDTLSAQVVTLLHEFGHIIDLLPEDADNLDGKSVRNTDEVLRHCRGEIEARTKQPRDAAMR